MTSNSKGEEAVNEILKAKNVLFERERTFSDLRSPTDNSLLPVDFAVNVNGFVGIIEYNGIQHYQPIGGTSDAADAWNRLSKNGSARLNFSKKRNIPLLIIHYKDFNHVDEVVEKFLIDVRGKMNNQTIKYKAHTKGFFTGYPYQTYDGSKAEERHIPFELASDEQREVYQIPNDAVITSRAYLEQLQAIKAIRDQSVKKFQVAVADMVTRINDLEDFNQDLEQKINELKAKLQVQEQVMAGHSMATFEGEFRISPSNRSQLTEDARHFIQRLSQRFDNDWNKVRNFIGDNYQEKISVTTIKKVCSTKEDF